MKVNPQIIIALALCFTLGLAPFSPQPHLFGKIEWIIGGAAGMSITDWFDFLLHLSPWMYLIIVLLKKVKQVS